MLVLSARVWALAQRIGPRPLLPTGPLVAAAGLLLMLMLMLRIGPDASYLRDVLPAVALFGAGLTLLVAPLTATALASAADRYAGVASGVNNAVARAAGLLAVAVVPVAAGLGGSDYTDPPAFADGFRTALFIMAALLAAGVLLAAVFVPRPLSGEPVPADPDGSERVRMAECPQCGVPGPAVHPPARAPAGATAAGRPPP